MKTHNQWKEMDKIIQDLKLERESMKKILIERNLEVKNLQTRIRTSEVPHGLKRLSSS